MDNVKHRKHVVSGECKCDTIHGNIIVYSKDYDPDKWRFSVERIILYICITVLIGMVLC